MGSMMRNFPPDLQGGSAQESASWANIVVSLLETRQMGRHGYHASPNPVNTEGGVFVMFMSLPKIMAAISWRSSK